MKECSNRRKIASVETKTEIENIEFEMIYQVNHVDPIFSAQYSTLISSLIILAMRDLPDQVLSPL